MRSFGDLIPALYTEADQTDGSLDAVVGAVDSVLSELEVSVQDLAKANTLRGSRAIDLASDVGTRYGNPFPFLSARRLLNVNRAINLVNLYKMRGSNPGLEFACWYLSGVRVQVLNCAQYAWKLGVSTLGHTTIIADNDAHAVRIYAPSSVPDYRRQELLAIAEFMLPANTQYHLHLQDGVVPVGAVEHFAVADNTLSVSGWAASVDEGLVERVVVCIDNDEWWVVDPDGVARADINTHMASLGCTKNCTNSEFAFSQPLESLLTSKSLVGNHNIKIYAIKHDGQMALLDEHNITL